MRKIKGAQGAPLALEGATARKTCLTRKNGSRQQQPDEQLATCLHRTPIDLQLIVNDPQVPRVIIFWQAVGHERCRRIRQVPALEGRDTEGAWAARANPFLPPLRPPFETRGLTWPRLVEFAEVGRLREP